jgi:hypothetical protein
VLVAQGPDTAWSMLMPATVALSAVAMKLRSRMPSLTSTKNVTS